MSIKNGHSQDLDYSVNVDDLDTDGFWAHRDEKTQNIFNTQILKLSRTGPSTEFCRILKLYSADISFGNKLDLDIKDNSEWTPLIHAAFNGHLKICEMIINNQEKLYEQEYKDNINKISESFSTFLSRRVKWNGSTALHLASARGHTHISNLLITKSIKYNPNDEYTKKYIINASDYDEATPLHCAVLGKHYETAQLLLKYGAITNKPDIRGKSPLNWAKSRQQIEYISLLNDFESNNTKDFENPEKKSEELSFVSDHDEQKEKEKDKSNNDEQNNTLTISEYNISNNNYGASTYIHNVDNPYNNNNNNNQWYHYQCDFMSTIQSQSASPTPILQQKSPETSLQSQHNLIHQPQFFETNLNIQQQQQQQQYYLNNNNNNSNNSRYNERNNNNNYYFRRNYNTPPRHQQYQRQRMHHNNDNTYNKSSTNSENSNKLIHQKSAPVFSIVGDVDIPSLNSAENCAQNIQTIDVIDEDNNKCDKKKNENISKEILLFQNKYLKARIATLTKKQKEMSETNIENINYENSRWKLREQALYKQIESKQTQIHELRHTLRRMRIFLDNLPVRMRRNFYRNNYNFNPKKCDDKILNESTKDNKSQSNSQNQSDDDNYKNILFSSSNSSEKSTPKNNNKLQKKHYYNNKNNKNKNHNNYNTIRNKKKIYHAKLSSNSIKSRYYRQSDCSWKKKN